MVSRTLLYHLRYGKLSFVGRPLYHTLVETELLYLRWKDGKAAFERTPLVNEKLTAIIKTFERPNILKRLIKSIKRLYPKMKIIVVDDSHKPSQFEGVTTITMPYDSGVSAGRQKALEHVDTPYVLLLDDDFVFYRQTDLEPAMQIMEANQKIDIMGGKVVNLPLFRSADYRKADLHPTNAKPIVTAGSSIAGLPVFDKVPNFYIARTKRLKLVGWDKRIKRLDHADFFTRAKGVLVTVFNKEFKVLHAQTPYNRFYMQKRYDIAGDWIILFNKYYRGR